MAEWLPRAVRQTWARTKLTFVAGAKPKIVCHTTETTGWPSYSSGASAPHFTVRWDKQAKKLIVRQHWSLSVAARALRNRSGGVETNRARAYQIEIIGTCEPGGPSARAGAYVWPAASDEALKALGEFIRELASETGVRPESTTKRWVPYPSSYGKGQGQRMSFKEWVTFNGVCGHEHVVENTHGDPGATDIPKALRLAGTGKPGPEPVILIKRTLHKGHTGKDVEAIQHRLNAWNRFHKIGQKISVDGDFGDATVAQVLAFKRAKMLKRGQKLVGGSEVGPRTVKALGGNLRWGGPAPR